MFVKPGAPLGFPPRPSMSGAVNMRPTPQTKQQATFNARRGEGGLSNFLQEPHDHLLLVIQIIHGSKRTCCSSTVKERTTDSRSCSGSNSNEDSRKNDISRNTWINFRHIQAHDAQVARTGRVSNDTIGRQHRTPGCRGERTRYTWVFTSFLPNLYSSFQGYLYVVSIICP